MTNKNLLKILFVEDLPSDVDLAVLELRKEKLKFEHTTVCTREDLIKALNEFRPDLIISDYMMPSFNGLQALKEVKAFNPEIPLILCTGSINEETAVECIKAGATDYVIKEHLTRLPFAVKEALEQHRILIERRAAELLLKENEEKLQSIFSAAPVGIGLVVNRILMEVNDTFCKMTGYTRKELIGKRSEMIYATKEEYESDGNEKYRQIAEKGIGSVETRFKCKNGKILNILLSSAPLDKDDLTKGVTFTAMDITERKRAEEALLERDRQLSTIYDAVGDVIFQLAVETHGNYRFISVNHAFSKVTGLSEEMIVGKLVNEVIPEPSLSIVLGKYNQAIKENSVLRWEETSDYPTGRLNSDVSIAPVFDNNGRCTHLVGSVHDLTERKKAEEAINQERRMLRTIIDHIPDTIYVKDTECRKILANIADVNYVGFEKEIDVLGKTDIELYPGQTGLRGYTGDKEVISSGRAIFENEEDFINQKGKKIWLLTSKIPLYDKDGNITGLIGVGHNITERKIAEETLKHSLAFSESLLKTIPFGMHIVDEEGNVLFQSEIFKRLFGEEAIGKKCWDLYYDDKTQNSDCPLTRGITIGESDTYESHGVLGNRIFEIIYTGMMYQGKKALLEIFQDITDRKLAEEELIKAKDKAEESDRLKTAFLHNISHEIRTPMNAIVGFSALLGESDVDVQTRKSYIEVIMQSSDHLLAIITDIVDISNIEANLVKTVKNEININSILKSLCNQFRPDANEKKIQLVCKTGLSDSEAYILTDNTKLTQILSNLINNALKFTDKGQINAGYKVKDGFLEFSVSDTGIGIPPEYHKRIFDRFYQLQSTLSKIYEGTGLGLAISKAYVELLGGKIWLDSEEGMGATFYFTIPYVRSVSASEAAQEKPIAEKRVFKNKKTILIAEDAESNFKLLKYFLTDPNIEIMRAENGKEAVEQCLSGSHIDLILMDIKMPVMDGYTAIKLIREANISIPVIAQTAYADDRNKVIEAGFSGFISKPFDRKNLLKVLAEFI